MRNKTLKIIILVSTIFATVSDAVAEQYSPSLAALSALVHDALASNPGIQSAQAALEAAIARETAARQPLYNPNVELDAEDAIDRSASIGLRQSIDWSDKRGARGQVASFEREQAAADLQKARQALAVELLSAIVQHDVANRLLEIGADRERLMRQFAALAAQRRELGDLSQVDLDLSRLALAEARLKRAQAGFDRIESWQKIVAVLGEAPGVVPKSPEEQPRLNITAGEIDRLINELPAMRVQMARVASAKALIKVRQLQKRPDPTIGVRLGQEESDLLAGVNISIPLFVRNTFRAEVDSATAELLHVELAAHDLYRRTRARMIAARDRYQMTYNAWMTWTNTGQISLRSQVDLLARLWRAGELSTTDYLVQLKQTLDTEVAAVQLHSSLWQGWFEWLAASGQVDAWLGLTPAP